MATGRARNRKLDWLIPVALLAVGALVSGRAYLAPGHPSAIDVWPHLARQTAVYQAIRTATSPGWSFMFYCGFPMMRFYAPLFALLGGLAALLLGGSQVAALKTLLFVLHLASGIAMFFYLRQRNLSAWAASIGSLVYLLVPWRIIHLAVIANYPQALVYLLLPLVFLGFEQVERHPGLRGSAVLALALGLLFASHHFYALFTCVLLLPAVLLGLRREPGRPSPLSRLAFLKLGGIGAFLVAGFFLIPFLAEFRTRLYPLAPITLPGPEPLVLLNPFSRPGGYSGGYLGLSCIILGLGSAVTGLLGRARRRVLPAVLGLGLALLLVFGTEFLGPAGNTVTLGLPGMRLLLFVVFFFGLLAAEGIAWLEERLARRGRLRTALLTGCAVLVCLDCLPRALWVGYPAQMRYLDTREEIYAALRTERPARVLDLYDHGDRLDDPKRLDCFPAIGYVYGGLPTPFGPHYDQFAPKSMLYVYPWTNLLATEFGDSTSPMLSENALAALGMMGISHIITMPTVMSREGETALAAVKPPVDWHTRYLEEDRDPPLVFGATGASLVLASTTTMPWSGSPPVRVRSFIVAGDWHELLDALVPGPGLNSVNFIPVSAGSAPRSLPGPASLDVLNQDVRGDQVTVRLRAEGSCFIRLAVSYYPELEVRLDGRPVGFGETADHFTWLECPAGEHVITATAPEGLLRTLCSILSLLAGLGCILALVLPPRRASPR